MRRIRLISRAVRPAIIASGLALLGAAPVAAQTIEAALVHAYQNNPQLNAQRASVRAVDENIPTALSGYRPRISLSGSAGTQYQESNTRTIAPNGNRTYNTVDGTTAPRSVGVTISQTLFNGQQTANRTRAAESQVSAAREGLRVLEQAVLLSAATIYMDFLRDTAIAEVQRSNVRVLDETLRQVRDRFNVGEVTRTDVAQSEAQLAAGRGALLSAESSLNTTRANFRRIIGTEPAARLRPGTPVDRLLPPTLGVAIDIGLIENPSVLSSMYGIDIAHLQVRISEGALFPTVTLQGSLTRAYETSPTLLNSTTAAATAQVTVPIYQGGAEYALIRQSKETLAQQRLVLEQVRDQARATVAQSWGQLQAARAQMTSAQAQVTASEVALNGVREEARVGQRTTLDVLNAQQALVNARTSLVTAQHARVVASYSVLSAIGRLSPEHLKLPTEVYDPRVHYHQVRDSWFGVRTPDGR